MQVAGHARVGAPAENNHEHVYSDGFTCAADESIGFISVVC
jgi:hypothetical protein